MELQLVNTLVFFHLCKVLETFLKKNVVYTFFVISYFFSVVNQKESFMKFN